TYKGRYLGGVGHLGCYSFHETKNISMGEGGALVINDESLVQRAEIIREKGTNRSRFFRGEVDKYSWVDVGSSYLPSDINAAVLRSQLEHLSVIQEKRNELYSHYVQGLDKLLAHGIRFPIVPEECGSNAHIFYMLMNSEQERADYISYMKNHDVLVVFHYVPLHSSDFARDLGVVRDLPITERQSEWLVRLPMY
ncbi:MAG: DegT/DnrJ/EryC1/StrS family aminotransferase, partial [Bacteroidota bacterium]